MNDPTTGSIPEDVEDGVADVRALTQRFHDTLGLLRKEVGAVIVGQDGAVDHLLLAVLVGGHCLITGMPGTAKTLMVRSLAAALGLDFKRIQFTPDLMPSDVTGTDVLEDEGGRRSWSFVPGPLFTNVLLADEINRTPPKTQAALLEAMQELSVTVRGRTHRIAAPFLVLATQNPLELEGTYPLPEAQLDRFLFNVVLRYLTPEQEMEVLARNAGATLPPDPKPCTDSAELLRFRELTRSVPVSDAVSRYAVNLVRATRPEDASAPEATKRFLSFGASVRSTLFLTLAAKGRALMEGRYHVTPGDVRSLAPLVLGHRIFRNYQAESKGVAVDEIVAQIVAAVPEPRA
jgi:MoxR-like ATPase